MYGTLKTLALAAAFVATLVPAAITQANAAPQCYPTVQPSADPSPPDWPERPGPKCDFPAGKENHEMAGLYLFNTRCEHKPSALLMKLSVKFEKLPNDIRATALKHEAGLIEAIPDLYWHEKWIAPGGWTFFCKAMNLWNDSDYFDHVYGGKGCPPDHQGASARPQTGFATRPMEQTHVIAAAIIAATLSSPAMAFYTECTVTKDTELATRPNGPTEPRYMLVKKGDKVAFRDRYQNWWFVMHEGNLGSDYGWLPQSILGNCTREEGTH